MNIHAVGVHTARPAEGGCTRGVSAERFETPLVGGAARLWRRGGNPPAPAFPRRGKRESGIFIDVRSRCPIPQFDKDNAAHVAIATTAKNARATMEKWGPKMDGGIA